MNNFVDKNELLKEVRLLIETNREGEYWDFKEIHHSEKGKLLHDIICLANSSHNGNKFIIYGIKDKTYEVKGVEKDTETQANLLDWISKIKFSCGIRPEFELHHLIINEVQVDVLVIFNDSTKKPYYLQDQYREVRANHIYTRTGDKNTDIDKSADINQLEKMFRQRFSLDAPAIERYKKLLNSPSDWKRSNYASIIDYQENKFSSHDEFPIYHGIFPEFKIKIGSTETVADHPFFYFYVDSDCYKTKIKFNYYATTLIELWAVYCANQTLLLPWPNMQVVFAEEKLIIYYYISGSYEEIFLNFLHGHKANVFQGPKSEKGAPFPIFDNENQAQKFLDHLKTLGLSCINEIIPEKRMFMASNILMENGNIREDDIRYRQGYFMMRIHKIYIDWQKNRQSNN